MYTVNSVLSWSNTTVVHDVVKNKMITHAVERLTLYFAILVADPCMCRMFGFTLAKFATCHETQWTPNRVVPRTTLNC